MKIFGLQKLTLLDFPGHVACTVFLAGCQFRCPFCHNSGLLDRAHAEVLMESGELLDFLSKRKGILDGVAMTGGEPLLDPGLPTLLGEIKALGYAVKLDTNGALPDRLADVLSRGLVDSVAMDIKNSPARYAETIGLPAFDLTPIRESVSLLLSGETDFEFRTTVVREFHDEDSFEAIGRWIEGAPRYFLQTFTDRDSVLTPGLHAPSSEQMHAYADLVRPFVKEVALRGIE